ncbi:Uncharacterised protein [Mycobacteroides abscessus subsp. abscessus]|nr:Uncharacterised protein [Mycobacteroides abscessus subsp. abscessus]
MAAKAVRTSPATMPRNRSSEPPARSSRPAPITTVSTNGSTTRARPNSSAMTSSSAAPPPMPSSGLPALTRLHRGAALLEVVPGGEEAGDGVAQELLLLGECEVHQSPNAALARMFR